MIIAFIQARTGSSRLPGKVMMPLGNMPVIWHVWKRVASAKTVDMTVVLTTQNDDDNELTQFCLKNNIPVFRGPDEDVLKRFALAFEYFSSKGHIIDYIVRITADCPLMDPCVIDNVVLEALKSNVDYTSNVDPPTYPDGLDVEVLTKRALIYSDIEAVLPSEREHVTQFIWNHPNSFTRKNVRNIRDLSYLRWTLDTPEDYTFIKAIYDGLFDTDSIFGMSEVLDFVQSNPQLNEINAGHERNEGLKKSKLNDR